MILLKPVHYEKIAPCSMPPWACLLCSSILRGETKSSQSQRSLVWPVLQFCTSLRGLNPWINPWMNPWMIRKCRIGLKMNPWYMLECDWNTGMTLGTTGRRVWAVLSPKQNGHRKLPSAPKWDQQGLAKLQKLGWGRGSDLKDFVIFINMIYYHLVMTNIAMENHHV